MGGCPSVDSVRGPPSQNEVGRYNDQQQQQQQHWHAQPMQYGGQTGGVGMMIMMNGNNQQQQQVGGNMMMLSSSSQDRPHTPPLQPGALLMRRQLSIEAPVTPDSSMNHRPTRAVRAQYPHPDIVSIDPSAVLHPSKYLELEKTRISIPQTPTGTQLAEYPYMCPICFLHFREIYRTICCDNSICVLCALAHIKNRASDEVAAESWYSLPTHESIPGVSCPICATASVQFAFVRATDRTRSYQESPHTRQLFAAAEARRKMEVGVAITGAHQSLNISNNNNTNNHNNNNKAQRPSSRSQQRHVHRGSGSAGDAAPAAADTASYRAIQSHHVAQFRRDSHSQSGAAASAMDMAGGAALHAHHSLLAFDAAGDESDAGSRALTARDSSSAHVQLNAALDSAAPALNHATATAAAAAGSLSAVTSSSSSSSSSAVSTSSVQVVDVAHSSPDSSIADSVVLGYSAGSSASAARPPLVPTAAAASFTTGDSSSSSGSRHPSAQHTRPAVAAVSGAAVDAGVLTLPARPDSAPAKRGSISGAINGNGIIAPLVSDSAAVAATAADHSSSIPQGGLSARRARTPTLVPNNNSGADSMITLPVQPIVERRLQSAQGWTEEAKHNDDEQKQPAPPVVVRQALTTLELVDPGTSTTSAAGSSLTVGNDSDALFLPSPHARDMKHMAELRAAMDGAVPNAVAAAATAAAASSAATASSSSSSSSSLIVLPAEPLSANSSDSPSSTSAAVVAPFTIPPPPAAQIDQAANSAATEATSSSTSSSSSTIPAAVGKVSSLSHPHDAMMEESFSFDGSLSSSCMADVLHARVAPMTSLAEAAKAAAAAGVATATAMENQASSAAPASSSSSPAVP